MWLPCFPLSVRIFLYSSSVTFDKTPVEDTALCVWYIKKDYSSSYMKVLVVWEQTLSHHKHSINIDFLLIERCEKYHLCRIFKNDAADTILWYFVLTPFTMVTNTIGCLLLLLCRYTEHHSNGSIHVLINNLSFQFDRFSFCFVRSILLPTQCLFI